MDDLGQIKTIPYTYVSNGTTLIDCRDFVETTNGELLTSGSSMVNQTSCGSAVGNAGNWYSWPASTAGGSKSSGLESNSVCPKGWQLSTYDSMKNFNYLIRTAYYIQDAADTNIRPLPLSFICSGYYNLGALGNRESDGYYWSDVANSNTHASNLTFNSGRLYPQFGFNKYYGFAVRCVSR